MARAIYFSNYSENTHRFVQKLGIDAQRIPLKWDATNPLVAEQPYVLFVPTYGGGSNSATVPPQVKKFLAVERNRELLVGVIGLGNTNFGNHFCRAAYLISEKVGVPIIDKVEVFGTPEDVQRVKRKMEEISWNER